MVFFLFIPVALYSAKGKEKKVSPSGQTQIEDKEIIDLHKRLNKALKKYSEGDRREEYTFQLDLGLNNRITDPSPSVFVVKAHVILKGGQVSYVEFYYMQSDVKTLISKERKIINYNVQSNDLSNLELVYDSSEANLQRYRLMDIKKPEDRIKVILLYRDYLKKLIRALEYVVHKRSSDQTKDINEILRLGTSK
ncbi:MAG: hypothetical protein D6767_11015 [Candidatus Hydrogenedentota bacterium]|nr:MAG: hypothetical protein D6767_11015 [Candidatus Hydrogenedentota bacterium]